ncbi:uncharacterized protein LOC120471830 [Pimephales promelas]|uniref:uncharacterized protein LOC120471830 n=1 Tax=Pimephales promelas TaxID=90988 RepID=UPI0019554EE8|nr:uncharacterized protein LOC120471830 [Pimephales promelas]KAG1957531.1 hypothetical protein F2P79_007539 [Pimephales promelas]
MNKDQEFKELVRVLYKFVRAFHHVWEIKVASETKCPPARLQKLAAQISGGIQPAFPNLTVKWLIFGNANNWLNTEMDILTQHYQDTLEAARLAMNHMSKDRWRDAFVIATKWARRNIKKIREGTIREAYEAITRIITQGERAGPSEAPVEPDLPQAAGPFPSSSSSASGGKVRVKERGAEREVVVQEAPLVPEGRRKAPGQSGVMQKALGNAGPGPQSGVDPGDGDSGGGVQDGGRS